MYFSVVTAEDFSLEQLASVITIAIEKIIA